MRKIWQAILRANGPWYCPTCGAPYSTDAEGAAHMAATGHGY